ncbi:MAG: 16S rRNA (cytosine(967)-C(5))-methyltransferase RsmB [Phycisphaerae bacterium]|nr:16S rRNA (cytosine(967)-C(5))-methyltransferase RsmB [Phycisphaerae bacterium]
MSTSNLSPRQAAWTVLNHFNAAKHNSAELIEKFGGKSQNRAAVVDIVFGIIRNFTFIDRFIAQSSNQSIKNIPEKLLNCLRIAVYELVFTGQADYAVVNEAVNLARKIGSKKGSGFVNAVLRKICGSIKNRTADLNEAEPQKTIPISPAVGCEFNIGILPDANKQQAQYLAVAFSLPQWLVEQWLEELGLEKTKSICFASNRRPSVYARPNSLKLTAQELVNILKEQDTDCELDEQHKMVKLNKPGNVAELESFKSGLFTIQDATSSSVIPLLNPQPGWKVFDLCAAPGTKTTQIAEVMSDKGLVIATDKDSSRLAKVDENVQRLGITSIKTMNYDVFLKEADKLSPADAVLLDVPCSNTGVMAKRPEVRLRLDKKRVEELAKIQIGLLEQSGKFVKRGGKICYSTCSILNQENKGVVESFLAKTRDFELESQQVFLPSAEDFDCDGGFAAVLIKK